MKNYPNLDIKSVEGQAATFAEAARESLKGVVNLGVSIDLETPIKGTFYHTGIFSIGVVPFDIDTGKIFEELAFYSRADFTQVVESEDIDPYTLKWWMQQEEAARSEIINKQVVNPCASNRRVIDAPCDGYEAMLIKVVQYFELLKARVQKVKPLGNGKEFDVTLLENTLAKHGHWRLQKGEKETMTPWMFWEPLDLRQRIEDAEEMLQIDIKKRVTRVGTHHNAVDDALHQAKIYVEPTLFIKRNDSLFPEKPTDEESPNE